MNEEAAIMLVLSSTRSMFLATRPRSDVNVVSSLMLGKTTSARPLWFWSCMKIQDTMVRTKEVGGVMKGSERESSQRAQNDNNREECNL